MTARAIIIKNKPRPMDAEGPRVSNIITAPPNSGESILGLTIPQLLDRTIAEFDNPLALNQPKADDSWYHLSASDFKAQSQVLSAGLQALGLEPGERIGLYLHSDISFCLGDMAAQMGGFVDVPLYLAYSRDLIEFVLQHAEVKTICVGDRELLDTLIAALPNCPTVRSVVFMDVPGGEDNPHLAQELEVEMPEGVKLLTQRELEKMGNERLAQVPSCVTDATNALDCRALATILYTSGTTGQPKGVMLCHENMTSNSTANISGMIGPGFKPGPEQRALSFLPMTHIFARTLNYSYVGSGISVYYVPPKELASYFKPVSPTIFITVPHVIQKLLTKILEKRTSLSGLKGKIFDWSMKLARQYEIGKDMGFLYNAQLKLARKLVFSKWREGIGGEIRHIISGGAPLSAELANIFAAADISILQGYGLTESSPVISFNRPNRNQSGTIGVPIDKVEVGIGPDGEILSRGPHIMLGYYKNEEATAETISDGWLHTGDIGEILPDGFIKITDRKKSMFKLSTGKYITPSPLEQNITKSPFVDQSLVVGADERFCGAVIFVDEPQLLEVARVAGVEPPENLVELLDNPLVAEEYKRVVQAANEGMPKWSRVKRMAIVYDLLSIEGGTLTPTLKLKRNAAAKKYSDVIEGIYHTNIFEAGGENWRLLVVEDVIPGSSMEF